MKKTFSLFVILMASSLGLASAQDVVAADSTAVEATFDATSTSEEDYSFLFESNEVDFNEGVEKGDWELHLDLYMNTSTGTSAITSDESGGFNVGFGYNVLHSFYAGLSTGYWHDFGGTSGLEAGDFMPFMAELQLRWNVRRKLSIYAQGRGGLVVPIVSGKKDVPYRDDATGAVAGKADFDYPSYLYYEVQPGLMYRLSPRVDLRLSVHYAYAKPFNESKHFKGKTYDETIIGAKLGIGYRF